MMILTDYSINYIINIFIIFPDESIKSVMWCCWQCFCVALYVFSYCKAGTRILVDERRLTNRVEELSLELTGEFTLESHHSSRRIRRQELRHFSDFNHSVTTVLLGYHELWLVQWAGKPTPRLFVITKDTRNNGESRNNLFRSQDDGTLVNETNKLLPDAVVDKIYVSRDSIMLTFSDIVNKRIYITTDAGETYIIRYLQFQPSVLQFSYHDSNNIFVMDNLNNTLYVTTYLGDSWISVSSGVAAAYWSQVEGDSTLYFVVNNTINTPPSFRVMKTVYPYRHDAIQDVLEDVVSFKAADEYLFAIKTYSLGSPLFVSYKGNRFTQAEFLPQMHSNKHYTVVDASQGQVLLAVYEDFKYADLYISDEKGVNYSLSLRNINPRDVIRSTNENVVYDLHKVEGTKGTYIANVLVDIDGSNIRHVTTVISFNKGTDWIPLTAPNVDANGEPLNCFLPDCSLHINMTDEILSKESAVGLIMIKGNVGRYVTNDGSIYLSRDGGFTWQQLFQNTTSYFQFLGNGSVIVSTVGSRNNDILLLSCDEGITWQSYRMIPSNYSLVREMIVTDVYTESTTHTELATFVGIGTFPFVVLIVVNINTSRLNLAKCDDNDYTTWIPTDGRLGDRCVLGERIVYRKRKPGHCCHTGSDYWNPISVSTCQCSIGDFGCDLGFRRSTSSLCVPVNHYPNTIPMSCAIDDHYTVSSGYRRIAGDTCQNSGDSNFDSRVTLACPDRTFDLQLTADPSTTAVNTSIIFSVTSNENGDYYFTFGDNNDSSNAVWTISETVTHSYSAPGYYTVRVLTSTIAGNASTEIVVLIENTIARVEVEIFPDLDSAFVKLFIATTEYQTKGEYYNPVTYKWFFSFHYINEIIVYTTSPLLNHTFEEQGYYQYNLIVYNEISSVQTGGSFTVADDISDRVEIIGPDSAALHTTVAYYLHIDYYIPNQLFYGWKIINLDSRVTKEFGPTQDMTFLSINFNDTGTYRVMALGIDKNGNYYLFNVSKDVHIEGQQMLFIVEETGYIGVNEITQFTLLQVPDGSDSTNYTWYWGDGSPNTVVKSYTASRTQTHMYTTPGSFTITVTVKDGGSDTSVEKTILVLDSISRVIIYIPVHIVVDVAVTFAARVELTFNSTYSSPVTYQWSYNGGNYSGPTHTFHETGTQNVTCTATNFVSHSTTTSSVNVKKIPVNPVRLVATPSVAAVNQTVTFSMIVEQSGNYSYIFSFGDGEEEVVTTSSVANHSYSSADKYLTMASANDSDHSFSKTISVEIQNYITCINVDSFVSQFNVTFLVKYCGNEDLDYGTVTYQWDFGDGNTASSTFPSIFHHYQTPGTWIYRLIASNAVSEVPLTRSVNIEAVDQLTIVGPTIALANKNISLSLRTLNQVANGIIYTWNITNEESSQVIVNVTGVDLVHYSVIFPVTGMFIVSVSGGNLMRATLTIRVIDAIICVLVNTFINATNVQFDVSLNCGLGNYDYGDVTYQWDFGDGNTARSLYPTISHIYQTKGNWTFTVMASNTVSEGEHTGSVDIKQAMDDHLSIVGPTVAPVGKNITFSVTGTDQVGINYTWTITNQDNMELFKSAAGTDRTQYSLVFPFAGVFVVSVSGNNMLMAILTINIRHKIGEVRLEYPPIVEVKRQATIAISLYDLFNVSYNGAVNMTILSDATHQTQPDVRDYEHTPSVIMSDFSYSVSSTYQVIVTASNLVSQVSVSFAIEAVRTNTTILLQFDVGRLSQANVSYEDSLWREQFSDVVDNNLTTEHHLPDWQLIATAGSIESEANLLEMFVDVLPTQSSASALANATEIAFQLIRIILDDHYQFLLPNSSTFISASSAEVLGISRTPGGNSGGSSGNLGSNDESSLPLDLGMGIGILLLIVVIVFVVAVVYCTKKYRRLKKEYGKLSQSDQASFFINDEVDIGPEDIPMREIVLEAVTDEL
ncbi:uncharacterized protein [Dysidea avara]|uniref:uncharacterized protein isoform X2 n=1 Tax=Dysidea avara TaxID=196820 RepID=UPI0033345A64